MKFNPDVVFITVMLACIAMITYAEFFMRGEM